MITKITKGRRWSTKGNLCQMIQSVLIFTKGNNYQSITQRCTRFDFVKKTGKQFLPQIHLQQLVQLSYQISTVRIKLVVKKQYRYFDKQVVLPSISHNTLIKNGSQLGSFSCPIRIPVILSNEWLGKIENPYQLKLETTPQKTPKFDQYYIQISFPTNLDIHVDTHRS